MGSRKAVGVYSKVSKDTSIFTDNTRYCAILAEVGLDVISEPALMDWAEIRALFEGDLATLPKSIVAAKYMLEEVRKVLFVPVEGSTLLAYKEALSKIDGDDFNYDILLCPDVLFKLNMSVDYGTLVLDETGNRITNLSPELIVKVKNTYTISNDEDAFAIIKEVAEFCERRIKTVTLYGFNFGVSATATGYIDEVELNSKVNAFKAKVGEYLELEADFATDGTEVTSSDIDVINGKLYEFITQGYLSVPTFAEKHTAVEGLVDKVDSAFMAGFFKGVIYEGVNITGGVGAARAKYVSERQSGNGCLPIFGLSRGLIPNAQIEAGRVDSEKLANASINTITLHRGVGPVIMDNYTLKIQQDVADDTQYLSTMFTLGVVQDYCDRVSWSLIGDSIDSEGKLFDAWRVPVEGFLAELQSKGILEEFEVKMDIQNNTAEARSKATVYGKVYIVVAKGARVFELSFEVGTSK